LKGRVARASHLADGESAGALWANGFHGHAIRADENLLDVARYIVLNPVRAGLVTRVQMYPFWNSVWLGGEEQSG
jgi:putative transposase